MVSVRRFVFPVGAILLAGVASTASAQAIPAIPVAPAAGVPAAAAGPVDPGPGFLGRICIRLDACKRKFALTPLGQLLANAKKPLAALTGGLLGNPLKPTDKDLAQPGAGGAAAAGKKDAAEAKKRREDVAYLGTLDCRYYPNASVALADSLRTDPSECVRYEAALALSKACCCNAVTVKALMASVSGTDVDGNPAERSARVRCTAAAGLDRCLACYTPPYEEVEAPKPPKLGEDKKGEDGRKTGDPDADKTDDKNGTDGKPNTRFPAPSPKLVQRARDVLREFQTLVATAYPQIQAQVEPAPKSVFHLVSGSQPVVPVASVAPSVPVSPPPAPVALKPAPRPPAEPVRAATLVAPTPTPTPEPEIKPAAAVVTKFVPETDDAGKLKALSLKVLTGDDVDAQHIAIHELARYDWKAQPLVAATLLYGAKCEKFRDAIRVDCLRMLAANQVAHPQVIDGLTALSADRDPWISREATQALSALTAGK